MSAPRTRRPRPVVSEDERILEAGIGFLLACLRRNGVDSRLQVELVSRLRFTTTDPSEADAVAERIASSIPAPQARIFRVIYAGVLAHTARVRPPGRRRPAIVRGSNGNDRTAWERLSEEANTSVGSA